MTIASRAADELLPLRPVVFHVLLSLAEGERHGYAIVQDIVERSNGRVQLEPGNLYRHLKFMLDERLIEESERRPVAGQRRRAAALLPADEIRPPGGAGRGRAARSACGRRARAAGRRDRKAAS